MTSARASIVILAWNEWARTRDCLDSLRPTLGPTDEVIVVDNGSTDGTARGLRAYGWATVISNPQNLGFAAGCNQGAAAASGEVLVFLNNDTVLAGRWLEPLLAALSDPTIAAAGPRSNCVSGPQLVPDVDYAGGNRRSLRDFARRWSEQHRDERTDVDRLVGFCLAVRASAFAAAGGFDEGYGLGGFEDDELCATLRAAGHRLVIAHGSFVHHVGHATFDANGVDWFALQEENGKRFASRRQEAVRATPLVSACMIVKDESAMLPDCLASLVGVVDEVVVYDTGSTDATVELARAAGARVVEGYWDDDFARARNVALAECAGTWILQIDADERLEGDVEGLRRTLESSAADALVLRIDNEVAEGVVDISHSLERLFRRDRAHWEGRLHEQLVPRAGGEPLRRLPVDGASLRHLGYRTDLMAGSGKAARNLAIAEAELAAGTDDAAVLLLNVGRSLSLVGRHDEALARADEAVAASAPRSHVRFAALQFRVELLLGLERPEEALAVVAEMAEAGERPEVCQVLADRCLVLDGDPDAALRLANAAASIGGSGWSVAGDQVRARAALALYDAGRWAEAASTLLELVQSSPGLAVWSALADATLRAGEPIAAVADAVPPPFVRKVLTQLLTAEAGVADALGEALHERWPGDARVLGFAVHLAPRLAVERALDWAVRLRTAGFVDRCPLQAIAADDERPAADRTCAVAVLHAAFADPAAAGLLPAAVAGLDVDAFPAALVTFDELAPDLLADLVRACASDARRAEAMAGSLEAAGADEQAALLKDFAEVLNPVG